MKYSVTYRDGGQETEIYPEVEADDPREAMESVECPGLNDSWEYEEEADGSACLVDPESKERSYRASPLSRECEYCGAEVPSAEIALVPAAGEDAEWDRLALHHFTGCEWIESRGNQRTRA